MEEVKVETGPVQTAVMVVYDHDLSKSKKHTGGVNYQQQFEVPWARNIRVFAFFNQHIKLLRASTTPRIVMGVATFGEYRERIVGSWAALGVMEDSLLICAKFVKKSVAKFQGKNEHIALLLQEHYRRHPNIKITQVYLLDDDPINIKNCGTYPLFIQNDPWKADPRLNIPVEGILVPVPELVMKPSVSIYMPRETNTHFDNCLKMDVETESPLSEWQFLKTLSVLERKLGIDSSSIYIQSLDSRGHLKKSPAQQSAVRRLTKSFDNSGFLNRQQKPLAEIGNLNHSGDASNNSVSDDDEVNDIFEEEVDLLFLSI